MRLFWFAAVFAASCLICSVAGAADEAAATPEMFGALPAVSEAAISPDGSRVAFLQNGDNDSALIIYNLDDPSAKPIGARVGGYKARSIEWADNDYVLFLISFTKRLQTATGLETLEFWRWVSVSAKTGKPEVLFGNEGNYFIGAPGELVATTPDAPGDAIFFREGYNGNAALPTDTRLSTGQEEIQLMLWRVDLKTGRQRRLEKGSPDTREFVVDKTGEPVIRIDYDSDREERRILKLTGGSGVKEIAAFPEKRGIGSVVNVVGLSPKPGELLITRNDASGRRSLVEMNMDTGALGRVLFANDAYDIDEVVYDPAAATATGVRYVDDLPRTFHLDPSYQTLQEKLRAALPRAAPMIISRSQDGGRMIIRAVYTDHPDQIFLFDRASHHLDMISPTYEALDGKVFAHKEKFDYTSSDGLKIPGYLTVPQGAAKSNMPLIVLPHGGPAGRDDQSFDWWSFFYAARGYLVYQPNFRGSDGYGEDFRTAGFGEWGRKMQDDITEGVKKLIADGVADPDRICIVGASYGGYAALAGATLTPDLYACAVSVAGISDLVAMIGRTARWSEEADDYWDRRIGSRFRDQKALYAVSPAKIAYKAGAPILLIHGKDDTVVPISQSMFMRDALEVAGKPFEYIELEGEDHWLSRSKTRTEMLARSIKFIDKYIGAKTAQAAN